MAEQATNQPCTLRGIQDLPLQRPRTESQKMTHHISPDEGLKMLESMQQVCNALQFGSEETLVSFIKAVLLRIEPTEHAVIDKLHAMNCGHLSDEAIALLEAGLLAEAQRVREVEPTFEGVPEGQTSTSQEGNPLSIR